MRIRKLPRGRIWISGVGFTIDLKPRFFIEQRLAKFFTKIEKLGAYYHMYFDHFVVSTNWKREHFPTLVKRREERFNG